MGGFLPARSGPVLLQAGRGRSAGSSDARRTTEHGAGRVGRSDGGGGGGGAGAGVGANSGGGKHVRCRAWACLASYMQPDNGVARSKSTSNGARRSIYRWKRCAMSMMQGEPGISTDFTSCWTWRSGQEHLGTSWAPAAYTDGTRQTRLGIGKQQGLAQISAKKKRQGHAPPPL